MSKEKSIIDLAKEAQEAPQTNEPAPSLNSDSFSNVPEDENMKATLEGLLENVHSKLQYKEVELPSKGLFYKGTSKVSVRPLIFEDERNLRNLQTSDDINTMLNSILSACTKGVPPEILTPPDRLYILFKIRELSYGDDYKLEQNCNHCGVKNSLTLKISSLKVDYLEEDYTTFTLPDSQKSVSIRVPRASQMEGLGSLDSIMNNLYKFVHSVEGINDATIIEEFIRRTTVKDVDVLRTKIFIPSYGMEDKLLFNCMKCGEVTKANVIMNEYFFTTN